MVLISGNAGKDSDDREEAVVDYRGEPVDKTRTGGWLGAGLILGTEFGERVAVNGINMNLVTYLVGYMHLPAAKSATIVTNFNGTLNLLTLLAGFLADAKLGRYLTVAIFASTASVGLALLTLSTSIPSMRPPLCDFRSQLNNCIEANGKQLALLYCALYTIALGGGGIKANVSGFGSDQFDPADPKEEKAMLFFFNRFYFTISIGSLFAVTVLVYVQDHVGRAWGYGISAAIMLIGVIVLLAGTRRYRFKFPQGSPLTVIWRVIFLASKRKSLPHPSHPSLLNGFDTAKIAHTSRFKCLDKAAILDDFAAKDENRRNPWIVSTVTEVEEVKLVLKLVPIWATCILFWTVYSQMTTFTIEQATYMDRSIGSFVIPSGTFSVFLFISVLLITSLNERFFVPLARKLTGNVQGLTSLQRIGVGLVSSMLAMVAAAIVERHRRDQFVDHTIKIRAFWLVPQFFFVGAGEGFAYVGQLEFFIREAPEKMKSMSTGFFLSSIAMGFYVSTLLVSLVDRAHDRWLRSNLNNGRLEYFYAMLAILGSLNFMLFLVFSRRHQYKAQQIAEADKNEKELHN